MIYMQHYIMQSIGWVKIAEYACTDSQQVKSLQTDILLRHPTDIVEFKLRTVNHNQ